MQPPRHRPLGVTILAVLAGIAFIFNAFFTLMFLGAIPASLFGGLGFFGEALLGALLWGLMAAIWGWVAIGLWKMNPQAWSFVIILAFFNLVLDLISILGATTFGAVLPSILINAAILIYSLSSGVKHAFGFPDQPVSG